MNQDDEGRWQPLRTHCYTLCIPPCFLERKKKKRKRERVKKDRRGWRRSCFCFLSIRFLEEHLSPLAAYLWALQVFCSKHTHTHAHTHTHTHTHTRTGSYLSGRRILAADIKQQEFMRRKKKKKKKKVSPRIIYSSGMQRGEPDLNLERERKRQDHYSRPSLSCSWQAASGKFV